MNRDLKLLHLKKNTGKKSFETFSTTNVQFAKLLWVCGVHSHLFKPLTLGPGRGHNMGLKFVHRYNSFSNLPPKNRKGCGTDIWMQTSPCNVD